MRRRSGDGTTATFVVFDFRLLSNLLTYTLGMKLSFVSSKKNGKRQPDGRLSQLHLHIAALYDSLRGTSYDHDEPDRTRNMLLQRLMIRRLRANIKLAVLRLRPRRLTGAQHRKKNLVRTEELLHPAA
jgi:hypothetical protein